MCVASVVHDYYKDKLDYFRTMPPVIPSLPGPISITPGPSPYDLEKIALLKELLEIAKRIDAKLGDPDCVDPEKQKWLENLLQDSI